MKYILFAFIILGVLFTVSSCATSNKINALKPEPDDASPLIYETTSSFINLPITLKLKDIENQTNKFLSGVIYNDKNIEDDNIELTVWKQAPIKIEQLNNGKVQTTLPLKVNAKYRYGIDKFGIKLFDIKEFNFNGVITLESNVKLNNWQLKSATSFKKIDWAESPSIIIAGKNIPITYLINPALSIFKSDIEKAIDENIQKAMDFKPHVLDALDKIATPFLMNEEYESWLRIVPLELYTTDSKINKEAISFEMGLKCSMETLIGKVPEKKFDKNKIPLKPVAKMPDHITANVIAVSTYKDASKLITKNFQGQEFGDGKRKVTVQKVDLWHKNGKMIIALDLLGSINGTIYLSGFPQYNNETKEIFFDKLDYILDTKNALMKTANWLAQGYILKKIQENCRYSIYSNMEDGKKSILKYMNNYSPVKGVYVNGSLKDLEFEKIQLTNKAILAFIKSNGNVHVKIDGLE